MSRTRRKPTNPFLSEPPMPITSASAPRDYVTMVIKGYTFKLEAPYSAGQPLGVAEASVLNREWTQSVRAGFQGQVELALRAPNSKLSPEELLALQSRFQRYAKSFAFKALSQTRNSDPLTLQKHSIAKKIIDIRLNSRGETRQSFGEHRYETLLAQLMNNPEVIAQAEAQLDANREAADQIAGIMES